MATTYYIQPVADGGFAVQSVEDRLEDFYSYHRTREEAEASLANAYKRDAADELYAACELAALALNDYCFDHRDDREAWEAGLSCVAALKKARGEE